MYSPYHLGIFEGVHISREYEPQMTRIFEWLSEQASQGNVKAMTNLGVMHAIGFGTPFDPSQSFYWFQQASSQEDPAGIFNTGVAYERAEGVLYDPDVARIHYEQSARLGFIPAMLALAAWHNDPRRFIPDTEAILASYKLPAAMNDPEGLYQLGVCYRDGIGISRNIRKSVALMTQAAEMNHPTAQMTLRNYYCYKNADRPTKKPKLKLANDREMAIVWNFVLCTLHGTHDGLGHFLLPQAKYIGLAYPRSEMNCGPRQVCNDIVTAILAYKEKQRDLFLESRRWAEPSGIVELYPESWREAPNSTTSHAA